MAEGSSSSSGIAAAICAALKEVEAREEIHIVLAVEAGSRTWGLATDTSDYDVKFIYVRRLAWYVSLEESRRDVLDVATSVTLQEAPYPLDMHGWDITKALKMLRESNCSLVEWLTSPIIYAQHPGFLSEMHGLLQQHLSMKALAHHWLNKAKRHWREHFGAGRTAVATKKYVFVFQPLFSALWMMMNVQQPPTSSPPDTLLLPPPAFDSLRAAVAHHIDASAMATLNTLLEQKRAGQLPSESERLLPLDSVIEQLFLTVEQWLQQLLPNRNAPLTPFNALFYRYATHSWPETPSSSHTST